MAQRNTWQRERVRGALAEADGFVSAQALHQAREADPVLALLRRRDLGRRRRRARRGAHERDDRAGA